MRVKEPLLLAVGAPAGNEVCTADTRKASGCAAPARQTACRFPFSQPAAAALNERVQRSAVLAQCPSQRHSEVGHGRHQLPSGMQHASRVILAPPRLGTGLLPGAASTGCIPKAAVALRRAVFGSPFLPLECYICSPATCTPAADAVAVASAIREVLRREIQRLRPGHLWGCPEIWLTHWGCHLHQTSGAAPKTERALNLRV